MVSYKINILKFSKACASKFDTDSDLKGSCLKFDYCTGGVIASSDCSRDLSCCVDDKKLPYAANRLLTKEIFLKIAGNTTRNDAMYYYVVESMERASIENEYQIAAYLSQLIGETKFFKSIESITKEQDEDPMIGNNQTGDGLKFRGRGGILLRGKNNYALAQKRINGKSFTLLNLIIYHFRLKFLLNVFNNSEVIRNKTTSFKKFK